MDDRLMKQLGFTANWLAEHGVEMVYFPYTTTVSTSDILRRAWASTR
jgi:hypothetical protein